MQLLNNRKDSMDRMWMDKKWCMCVELKSVARDGCSTCGVCGGKDAYGGSKDRPKMYKKVLLVSRKSGL